MRILVYGAGVLGSNLAANLRQAGQNVTLLARGAWADEIEQKGLKIRRKYIGKSVQLSIPVIRTLEAEDVYDVIFVVMRCTQLCDVLPILQANASERVVFVGNNLDGYLYEKAMPEKDVYFAFCASAGQRKNGQVVGIDLKRITIGQFHTDEPADSFIHAIFQDTGYKVTYLTNMEDFLLCHAAYVVPVAFAVYRTDGQLKSLVKDPAYMERVLEAIREGYRAIEAAGHEILPPSDRTYDTEAYGRTCLRFLRIMARTKLGGICASDHALNATEEMLALANHLEAFFRVHEAPFPVFASLRSETKYYLDRPKFMEQK